MKNNFPWKRAGIYKIECLSNRKVYVGGSCNLANRKSSHRGDLNRGVHKNKGLQLCWDADGENGFTFTVLEIVGDFSELLTREQYWMDLLNAANPEFGFNRAPIAGSHRGVVYSAESRAKLSALQLARGISAETREKMRESKKGMIPWEGWVELMKKVNTGRVCSEETRRKISAAGLGKKRTEEQKAISRANRREKKDALRLTIDGETKTVREWLKVSGISSSTVRRRLASGLDAKEAVFGIPRK